MVIKKGTFEARSDASEGAGGYARSFPRARAIMVFTSAKSPTTGSKMFRFLEERLVTTFVAASFSFPDIVA